jgi:hypothetical protein
MYKDSPEKNKIELKIMNYKFKNLLFFCFIIISCKNENSNQNYNTKKEKEINDLIEFNPTLSTDLDINNIDSVLLENYYKNKLVSSKWIRFSFKSKIDTSFTVFKKSNYNFKLEESFIQKHDYKFVFTINKIKHEYFLEKIDFDTISNGSNIFYVTKSYILNGKKYDMSESVYYLDIENDVSTIPREIISDKRLHFNSKK